jgi:exodeoxyribonuclease VII small subunit
MKETTFEEAQQRIQEILQSIDSGNVSLSEVEVLLNEAQQLIDFSLEQLTTLENRLVEWDGNTGNDKSHEG